MGREYKLFQLSGPERLAIKPGESRVLPWAAISGDGSLRLDYPLDEDSVVYDVGGYKGEWAEPIFERYHCTVEIFEPINEYVNLLKNKFKTNKKVSIHSFGLAGRSRTAKINLDLAASSVFKSGENEESIRLEKASKQMKHKYIDLMKINIEGGEYELIEHLLTTGDIKKIGNIQVQFHDFVSNARKRRHNIQTQLARTHSLTYNYPFIWENWRLKDAK